MTPKYPEVRSGSQKKPFWREYGEALFIALIMALVIRAFLVQAFSIPSGSMQPTLLIGDYLLVNKFTYGIRNPLTNKVWIPISTPQRGDVVVFIFPQDPSKDYIKRVVGLPGDRIQIINKKVMINGKVFKTPEAVYDDPMVIPAPQGPTESARDNMGSGGGAGQLLFRHGGQPGPQLRQPVLGLRAHGCLPGQGVHHLFFLAGSFRPALLSGPGRGGERPHFPSFLEQQ